MTMVAENVYELRLNELKQENEKLKAKIKRLQQSKLDKFAGQAMGGIMANETFWSLHDTTANSFNAVAKYSVQQARYLLAELGKEGEE